MPYSIAEIENELNRRGYRAPGEIREAPQPGTIAREREPQPVIGGGMRGRIYQGGITYGRPPAQQEEVKEPGYASVVGKGLMRGTMGLGAGVGAAARWAGEVSSSRALTDMGATASQYWNKAIREGRFKPDEEVFAGSFLENPSLKRAVGIVAEAVPSLGAAIVTSIATGNPVAGAAMLGLLEGAPQYEEARQAGKGVGEASVYGGLSTVGTALLEYLPIGRMFKRGKEAARVAKTGAGKAAVKGTLAQRAKERLTRPGVLSATWKGGVEEAGQEASQQIYQNLIAKIGYDESRSITEGVIESIIGGAGAGGIAGGTIAKIEQAKERAKKRGATDQELNILTGKVSRETQDFIVSKAATTVKTFLNTGRDDQGNPFTKDTAREIAKKYREGGLDELANAVDGIADQYEAMRAEKKAKPFTSALEETQRKEAANAGRLLETEKLSDQGRGLDLEVSQGQGGANLEQPAPGKPGLPGNAPQKASKARQGKVAPKVEDVPMFEEGEKPAKLTVKDRVVLVDKLGAETETRFGKVKDLSDQDLLTLSKATAPELPGAPPKAEVDAAAHKAATSPDNALPEPTEAQIESGNYKKGHVSLHGLDISIENPAGSTRKGVSPEGKKWETLMHDHYGYFRGYTGKDKDHVDVFVGPKQESDQVYVVNQVKPGTTQLDEHKVMLGYSSEQEAKKAYLRNYEKGWKGLGSIAPMSLDQFKDWLEKGDKKKPAEMAQPKAVEREPWEMPQSDFVSDQDKKARSVAYWQGYHKSQVEWAVKKGKQVPIAVFEDYPDLAGHEPAPKAIEKKTTVASVLKRYGKKSIDELTLNEAEILSNFTDNPLGMTKNWNDMLQYLYQSTGLRGGKVMELTLGEAKRLTTIEQAAPKALPAAKEQYEEKAKEATALGETSARLLKEGGYTVAKQQPRSEKGEANLLKLGYKPYLADLKTGTLIEHGSGTWAKPPAPAKAEAAKPEPLSEIPLDKKIVVKTHDGAVGEIEPAYTRTLTPEQSEQFHGGSRYVYQVIVRSGKFKDRMHVREQEIAEVKEIGQGNPWIPFEPKLRKAEAEPSQEKIEAKKIEAPVTTKEAAPEDLTKKNLGELVDDIFSIINDHIGERGSFSTKEAPVLEQSLYEKIKPILQEIKRRAIEKALDIKSYILGAVDSRPEGKAKEIYTLATERFLAEDEAPNAEEAAATEAATGKESIDISQQHEYNGPQEKREGEASQQGEISHAATDVNATGRTEAGDRGGAEVPGPENLPGAQEEEGAQGVRGERPEEPGAGLRDREAAGAESVLRGPGTEPDREGSETREGAPSDLERGAEEQPGVQRPRGERRGTDHRIESGGITRRGSWRKSAKTNLDCIELVKRLDQEGRQATPEEQQLLAKYVGWGASELANNMFPGYRTGEIQVSYAHEGWENLVQRMVDLLTPEEIKVAAKTTQYAHYTSEGVVRSIYKAIDAFGFPGGRVLEPGMGSGNFFGLMPESVRGASHYTGIELDPMTAKIAGYLYPNQNVQQQDFIKAKLPNNFFDLAIGNPPFSSTVILEDLDYKKDRWKLHEYFLAKTMDKVRPGGHVVFVVSRWLMDKQSSKMRRWLTEQADFLGAVRLPQTAFKENAGTEVVTDVLFLRKKIPSQETQGLPWTELAMEKTDEGAEVQVNQYYAEHPEMVLGKHSSSGSMYHEGSYTVLPSKDGTIEEQFEKAIENLPKQTYSVITHTPTEIKAAAQERDFNPSVHKEGALYLNDKGELMQVQQGMGLSLAEARPDVKWTPKQIQFLKDYVPLKDVVKELQLLQLKDDPAWEKKLKELQKIYKAFVKKHGRLQAYRSRDIKRKTDEGETEEIEIRSLQNEGFLSKADYEYGTVFALESINDATGEIREGNILKGRTILPPTAPDIRNVYDALAVSLDQTGDFDPAEVGAIINLKPEEVVEQLGDLVYKDPEQGGKPVLADEYLSGDVVGKLERVREAAKIDPSLQRNVEALTKVQPVPFPAERITVGLGANWVPLEVYDDFMHEILGLGENLAVHYSPADNRFTVGLRKEEERHSYWSRRQAKPKLKVQSLRVREGEWGTPQRGPNEILESVLNNQAIRITYKDDDGKTIFDPVATDAANNIAKRMRETFQRWVWQDIDRVEEVSGIYNRKFNNLVGRTFEGKHLTLPGLSVLFKLYDHQLRAIWRIIQSGNTYLAHAVGSGKTLEMICAGMELRRLGKIKKPMYVVPNHMLRQFANEFQQAYPMANVMVADELNFHTTNRRRFIAQAALNNPDAIVLTHSAFTLLKQKEETIAPVRDQVLDELQWVIDDLEAERASRWRIKRAEQRREQAEQRFNSLVARGDDAMFFEDIGVDFLFVDEAHQFRKLDFATNRQVKGIDSVGSARSMDLFIKTKWLQKQHPRFSHVFASGTPITNTLGELYSLQRYFMENQMNAEGYSSFDSWATNFGEVKSNAEMNAASRYEMVERFRNLINVPVLMEKVRSFMDVLTTEQLGLKINLPKVIGGQPRIVIAPASDEFKRYLDNVILHRLEHAKNWKGPEPNPDPVVNIITDARLASIDMRYVAPGLPNNPGSKLNQYIDELIRAYNETTDIEYIDLETKEIDKKVRGGTIICFYNHGLGEAVKRHRGFDGRAWIMTRLKEAGIPASQVGWVDDYKSSSARQKLYNDIRAGRKRVLFGSAKKLGTGVNVQPRLKTMLYLDPPWYPADVQQPDGRILRQGNQNAEVEMIRFATKNSYDSAQWSLVASKAKGIDQAFSGDKSIDRIEDISEASQYELAAAMAAGDERMVTLVTLRADIERLNHLQWAHQEKQIRLKNSIARLGYQLPAAEERVKHLEEAAEKVPGWIRTIDGEVDGEKTDNREHFGTLVIDKARKLLLKSETRFKQTGKAVDEKAEIGTLTGVPITMSWKSDHIFHGNIWLNLTDEISYHVSDTANIAAGSESHVGLVTKMVNELNRTQDKLRQAQEDLDNERQEYEDAQRLYGTPFEYARELSEKMTEASRLQDELLRDGVSAAQGPIGYANELERERFWKTREMHFPKTMETGFPFGSEQVAFSRVPETAETPGPRTHGIPAAITKVITSYYNNSVVKSHPDYAAAKAGDREAAARLIPNVVNPQTVKEIRAQVGEGAIFVAPNAIEEAGKNKIPRALANYYAIQTGGSVDAAIVQGVKAFHTGAKAMERLISRVLFSGDVVKGGRYVLIDDVTTLGGTLAELSNHIQANGGKVVGVITLTNASRSATIQPSQKILNELERRYGREIRDLFGIEPKALTAAEAGYLIGFRDVDSLRNRATAARSERRQRLLSKGIRSPEEVAPRAYLRSERKFPGLTVTALQNSVGQFLSLLPNAPIAEFYEAIEDVPYEQVQAQARRGAGRIEAFFYKGKIHYIANNIPTVEKAFITTWHELCHFGCREIFGDRYNQFLHQVFASYGKGKLQDLADLYGYDLSTKEGRLLTANEKVALIVEKNQNPGLVRQLISLIRNLLREPLAALGINLKISDNDILCLVSPRIRDYLMSTKPETLSVLREGLEPLLSEEQPMFALREEPAPDLYEYSSQADRIARDLLKLDPQKLDTEKAHLEEELPRSMKDAGNRLLELWRKRKTGWKIEKPDTTVAERLLASPEFYFEKVPAAQKVFNAALEKTDNAHHLINGMLETKGGKGLIGSLEILNKENPVEYARLKNLIIHADRNKITLSAEEVKSKKFSDLAVAAWQDYRKIMDNGFDNLIAELKNLIARYEAAGLDLPEIAVMVDGKRVEVNLKKALAMMGDMRGYYAPRKRRSGRFMLKARKEGTNPILEYFDSETFLTNRQVQLEGQGYKVEKTISGKMPEDVFQIAGQTIGTQAMINQALEHMDVKAKPKTLADFGLTGTWGKTSDNQKELIITGPASKKFTDIFKGLGGKWYKASDGPKAWRFVGATKWTEKKIVRALGGMDEALVNTELMFAHGLAIEVANIIKGRGFRSSMIQRSKITGKDVWIGYEEDPIKNAIEYVTGIAHGLAKKTMAEKMVRAVTGTDIDWRDFDDYEEYLQEVKARRIDPQKQPNIFHDVKVYMEDMLRNEELSDRIIGMIKGIAVVKYLGGRVSAPLVNLTALVTSVPAAMNGYAGIPIHSTYHLLGDAAKMYGQYRFGDRSQLSPSIVELLDEIHDKGWNEAQYNHEALSVLQTKLGRGWDTAVRWSMLGFGATEQLNRVSTIVATYIGIKQRTPAKRFNHQEALALAKKVSDRGHGVYNKVAWPYLARGSNLAAQIGRCFMVFKKFSHTYLQTMYDLGFTHKNRKALLYMMASPAVLAGAGASVVWPVLMGALKMLLDADDPEEEIYSWVEQNFGAGASNFVRYGAPGIPEHGISLKGSLQIGITDLPTSLVDILGAPGSLVGDVWYGGENILKGNVSKGVERLLPRALGAPFQGVREKTEGVTTKSNAPVFYGTEQIRANTMDAIYRALSFNPTQIAKKKDILWSDRQVAEKYSGMRTDIYAKVRKFYLRPIEERSKADWIDIAGEIKDYNARVQKNGLTGIVPFIGRQSLKTAVRSIGRPPKAQIMKQRAWMRPSQYGVYPQYRQPAQAPGPRGGLTIRGTQQ